MSEKRLPRLGQERAETDATLGAERNKTDDELAKSRTEVERDADEVVMLARSRADARLKAARERLDSSGGVSAVETTKRTLERAAEDKLVAAERAAADAMRFEERDERRRILSRLLASERDATDERLVAERLHADAAVGHRDEFLGIVSHDLRGLLSTITLHAGSLGIQATSGGPEHAVYARLAERIQRVALRMNRLVGDLLDVVSLEAGTMASSPAPRDPRDLVRDTVEVFAPLFAAAGIEFGTDMADDTPLALFDHERILQVLANLLGNALKFTNQGGHVILSVAPVGEEVRFTVTDTGLGVPPERAFDIFERFQQARAADRRGLGLGLYIAKSIIVAHRGRIWLERPAAGGSAFHFTVPALS